MLDHMILTVSNVERSLAFYEAALKPLNIKFFLPYKGEGDHSDLWGFGDGKRAFFWIKQGKPDPASIHWGSWPKTMVRSMNSIGRQYPLVPGTIFHRGHDWNAIRDTSIRSRSSIKASDGTSNRQGTSTAMRSCRRYWRDTCSRLTATGRTDMAAHKETSMFTIDVRFTIQEAVALMQAIAAKRWTETDPEKRDDLELLRLRLYEKVYRSPAIISIDSGRLAA